MTQDMPLQDYKEIPKENEEDEWIEPPEEDSPNNMVVKIGPHSFWMHFILKGNLDNAKKEVLKRDLDAFFVIDGLEGFGKSTIAMQMALYCDNTFNVSRVCFTMEQFVYAVEHATKGQAIVFDETMGYLASRGSMSKFNRKLIKIFSEMRSKNLFIFLCIPSFFELDRYPAIHRSVSLIHVHKRGIFVAYNYNKKKMLYIMGKKFYAYNVVSGDFIGGYPKYFPLDKVEYEKKKQAGISEFWVDKEKVTIAMEQRNRLIHLIISKNWMSCPELADNMGIRVDHVRDLMGGVVSEPQEGLELDDNNGELFGIPNNSPLTERPIKEEDPEPPIIVKEVNPFR